MSKIVKWIITGLTIILITLSTFTYKSYQNIHKANLNVNNQVKQEQTYRVIDKSVVIDALNKQNKLVCLDGTTTVEATFTNENVSDQDVDFKWIKDAMNKLNSKSVKVQADISFDFTFDLTNLPISIHNNTVTITISPNKLSLNKCQLIENKSIYNEDIGLLSKRFTSQEINNINERVKELASNQILSQKDLRHTALENTKNDIYSLVKPLLPKDTTLVFVDNNYDVVQQDDVSIIK